MCKFQLVKYLSSKGEAVTGVMPGDIYVNNCQFTIAVQQASNFAWKKAIKQSYPDVIIGAQKSSHNINMKVI